MWTMVSLNSASEGKMLQEKKQVKKAVFDVEAADLGGVEAPGD